MNEFLQFLSEPLAQRSLWACGVLGFSNGFVVPWWCCGVPRCR